MVLPGVLALFAGAVLAFAVHGHVGGVSITAVGVITMLVGAAVLIMGLLRLRRRPGGRGRVRDRAAVRYQDQAYRTSKGKIIAMIIAVIYIVSPIDFIPDFLLPVGVIDDATAFTWLLFAIGQELTRRRRQAPTRL